MCSVSRFSSSCQPLAFFLLILTIATTPAFCQVAEPEAKKPRVLFDSYHAHNFLHRGLKEREYSYHQYSALRRAAKLLENRGCVVDELLIGPVSEEILHEVDLFVLNLPSMDRPPLLVSEVIAIENFVRGGGGILFVTDHSNCYYHQYQLLPLWRPLGLIPTFETVCIVDRATSLSSTGSGWALIRDFAEHDITSDIRYVATQTGGRVIGEGEIAWTAEQAWADAGATPLYGEGDPGGLYGDWQLSVSEDTGKQAIALARDVGAGRVCVIADQNCLSDAFIAYADNWKFWLNACHWTGRLQYETPRKKIPAIQIDCYEPLGLVDSPSSEVGDKRRFDFGADDPEQLFPFWVWMNRFHWVGAGDIESRPPETVATDKLLLVDMLRVRDPGFLARAKETLELKAGRVIILGDGVTAIEPVLRKLSEESEGTWRRTQPQGEADAASTDGKLKFEVFRWIPAVKTESVRPLGQLIHIADAAWLRSKRFPKPNEQPDHQQQELQRWLQGFLFSR